MFHAAIIEVLNIERQQISDVIVKTVEVDAGARRRQPPDRLSQEGAAMKVPARGLDTEEGITVATLMKTRIARLALGRRTLPQTHESLQGFARNHAVADTGLSPLTPKPHRRLLGKGSTVQKGVQVTLTVSMSPGSNAVHMASFWTRTVDADSLTSVMNVCLCVCVEKM